MEIFGSSTLQASAREIFAASIYPRDSRILFVPLNEDQHKCWLKFLEITGPRFHRQLTYGVSPGLQCYEKGKYLLELNHPFVPAVVNFAVDAFNELCRMYIKKGVEDNIYEAKIKSVQYSPNCYGYTFFIKLDALEEGIVGVYEATVICDYDDGRRTLLKFIRLPCTSVARNFKRPADFFCKKSRHDAVKGACHMRDEHGHQTNWKIKRSNPDDWFIPNKMTGLQRRCAEHACEGYDYNNSLEVFRWYLEGLEAQG